MPNIIIIFCDDLGYGDLACYGSQMHKTPFLDQMASEGMLFTHFYATSGVCTPSRASMLTGCYPARVDMHINARPPGSIGRQVLFPNDPKGLNPDEITIADVLKMKGYKTACIGKWHLGDQNEFLPTRQGFDYYFGIPYSNDMDRDFCPLPLMLNEKVIEAPVDQNTLTKRYTEEAIRFMDEVRGSPFFIYLPHTMPHVPIYASDAFRGRSANGIYGDAIEELDWSTGAIMDYLKNNNLDENTLLIFTSDNGADERYGGSNLPLSGWKGGTLEGGMRVPCIMRWPGVIPSNTINNELATIMDFLPTIATIVQAELLEERVIDGKNILEMMKYPYTPSPYEYFLYYQREQLQAVRSGSYKLQLPLDSIYNCIHVGDFKKGNELKLFNLNLDMTEQYDISNSFPEITENLLKIAEQVRQELGDLGLEGKGIRKAPVIENPVPQIMY